MDEVRAAIFEMAPYEAPCLDGYQPIFYQKFWSTVRMDLRIVVLSCLNSGILPPRT